MLSHTSSHYTSVIYTDLVQGISTPLNTLTILHITVPMSSANVTCRWRSKPDRWFHAIM